MKNVNGTKKYPAIIETHIHGAYGVNFNNAGANEIISLAKILPKHGVSAFLPTLHSDSVDNLKTQIAQIKLAQKNLTVGCAKIIGVHLEGPFINPEKCGIHDKNTILSPNIENYKLIEDDIIKIVTLAPELDLRSELCDYLHKKGVKISAGHTNTVDLNKIDCVTHLFNAMDGISHKKLTTTTAALLNDNTFIEIIADGIHVIDELLRLVFKVKPMNKTILVSDCLPIAYSNLEQIKFCGENIYLKNNQAQNENGTIAGSTMLLNDIIKRIVNAGLLSVDDAIQMCSKNAADFLGYVHNDYIYLDEKLNLMDNTVF